MKKIMEKKNCTNFTWFELQENLLCCAEKPNDLFDFKNLVAEFLKRLGTNPQGLIFIVKIYANCFVKQQKIIKDELLSFFTEKSFLERKQFLKVLLKDLDLTYLSVIFLKKDKVYSLLHLIALLLFLNEECPKTNLVDGWYLLIYNNNKFSALNKEIENYSEWGWKI